MSTISPESLSCKDSKHYTKTTGSFIFAKITCICDDAPFNYQGSLVAIKDCKQLIEDLQNSITDPKEDSCTVHDFAWFMNIKLDRIVCSILLDSFLESCIIEKWYTDVEQKSMQLFTSFVIQLLQLEFGVCGELIVFPGHLLVEILHKLNVIAAQRMKNYAFYENFIGLILHSHIHKPEILHYQCNLVALESTTKRDIKIQETLEYLSIWNEVIIENGPCMQIATIKSQLEFSKDFLLEACNPITKGIGSIVSNINILLFNIAKIENSDGDIIDTTSNHKNESSSFNIITKRLTSQFRSISQEKNEEFCNNSDYDDIHFSRNNMKLEQIELENKSGGINSQTPHLSSLQSFEKEKFSSGNKQVYNENKSSLSESQECHNHLVTDSKISLTSEESISNKETIKQITKLNFFPKLYNNFRFRSYFKNRLNIS